MNVWKRGLALLLGCVLLFALLPPVGTSRAEDELPIIPIVPIYKGVCGAQGDNLTWTLNSGTGVLTISGSGEMMDFAQTGQPWYQWRQKVRQLVFSAEMTGIGDNAFRGCTQLKEAILPENLLRIGTDAFAGCTALTALTVENPDCAVADGGATLGVPSITAVTADCGGSVAAYALDKDYQTALRHPERTTETVAPTCTEDGYTLHVCPRCGDSYRDGTVPAPGHDWGQPHYVWAADNGSVTASRTCKRDPAHVETETVNTTATVSTAPTCTEAGKTTYTAAFENPAFAAQTRTLTNVPAAGHVPGEAVVENRVEPSCTSVGGYDTVVRCAVCETELSREHTELQAIGHDWNAPSYEWSEDNAAVTASRVCRNDETHAETETVAATSEVTKEATVDEEGEITYTAEFTNPAFEKQTKAVAIPKLKPANPFDDVVEGKFYYDAVLWAVAHEPQITNGTSATTFSPNATCTRGQVVTFLWRAKGCPEPASLLEGRGVRWTPNERSEAEGGNPFTDVKEGSFYYKAVLWAVENGITNGTSATTFGPNDGCTRGQVVTFLWRTEGCPEPASLLEGRGVRWTPNEQSEAEGGNPFTDVKEGTFYYKAVLWAVENKITAGMDATHFAPMNTCTRGQIVTFLYRDLAE